MYLEERYGGSRLPQVFVVDLKEELKTGNRSMFSSVLTEKSGTDCRGRNRSCCFSTGEDIRDLSAAVLADM